MRLRFRSITYAAGGTPASLERHYRELRESMLRAGAHYGLQSSSPWRPPIDIHESPEAIVIKMELAGVGEDDINITLYDNALVVSGQRENDIRPDESVYYHEAQVRYGPFRADVLLPLPVDQDAVQATYEHGFLRIRLPKAHTREAHMRQAQQSGTSGGAREHSGGGSAHDAQRHAQRHAQRQAGEVETLAATTGNADAEGSASAGTESAGAKPGATVPDASGGPR